MSKLFLRLRLGDCFLFLVEYCLGDTPRPLLSVFLITSDIEVESMCKGTLCNSYLDQIGKQRIQCNPIHLSVQFLPAVFIAC